MPYDALSCVTIAASAALLVGAACIRSRVSVRLTLIVLAALFLRADAAYQWSLHIWDESFHALVASNLRDDPLRPALYARPALPYDPLNWMANHVWLHKPPGALWLMALSLKIFGTSELALRTPSVVLSTACVALTFFIGQGLVSTRVGLLAAGVHAVNGFLIALAAGRRVADHVDTVLVLFVELSVFAALRFRQSGKSAWLWSAGAACGAAFLTKTWPALICLPVIAAALWRGADWRRGARWGATVLVAAATVALPWFVYTWTRFPVEAAGASTYTLQHMTNVIEGQAAPWWTYLADLPRFFGELTPVALIVAIVIAAGDARHREMRVVLLWAAVPYVVFSSLQTRMPAYVVIGAPAVFIAFAFAVIQVHDRMPASGARRVACLVALTMAVLLTGRHLLEPAGPLRKRDRAPAFAQQLRELRGRISSPDPVIFNVPRPIDAMFYSGYTAYERMPTDGEVRDLVSAGRSVVIYQPEDRRVAIPTGWPVMELPSRN